LGDRAHSTSTVLTKGIPCNVDVLNINGRDDLSTHIGTIDRGRGRDEVDWNENIVLELTWGVPAHIITKRSDRSLIAAAGEHRGDRLVIRIVVPQVTLAVKRRRIVSTIR